MNGFNLTEWSLKNRGIVYFMVILTALAGVFSYETLGRMEKPDFLLRQMLITLAWPGATARQIEEQVTDKIERKLQDTPGLDYIQSYSQPGQSVIFVYLKETTKKSQVRPTFLEIRNMVNDIKLTLPDGVIGPMFNDRFDDVYGSIYALTGDGFSYEEMRVYAEKIRRELMRVDNVRKIELAGVQPEKIYIEMDTSKMAGYGIDPMLVIAAVKAQNATTAAGNVITDSDTVYVRVSGMFDDVGKIRSLPIRIQDKTFRLDDIAKVERGYADPPEPKMYFNGKPAIGINISMEKGGNVTTLGEDLNAALGQIRKELPLGLEIGQVADQPQVVQKAIHRFFKTIGETVIIVLLVSFLSLGLRTGFVVALCIPLVMAGTLAGMKIGGIDMHEVSLGSLIMALGLLVDDAIIAVEMMSVRLEQGADRFKAACHAYTVTAFPMLTGTLITCAGYIPIGFSNGLASEYCNSMFWVLTIALLISWVVSVMVAPLLGYHFIGVKPGHEQGRHDIYESRFYTIFRRILTWCLTYRKTVLIATLGCFLFSVYSVQFLQEEFFPKSTRPELIVEMKLPEGSSIQATDQEAQRFAGYLADDANIDHYTYYVGGSSPRFILNYEPVIANSSYAQFVIVTKGVKERDALEDKINTLFATEFAQVRGHIQVIQNGPPDSYPVMVRVSGKDHEQVRALAQKVGNIMAADSHFTGVNYNWLEKSKSLQLRVDQDKARMLGIDSTRLAQSLQAQVSGIAVSEFKEDDKTIAIMFRLDVKHRQDLSGIKDLNIPLGNGRSVPLEQIAHIDYDAEDGAIWRRNLKPTITVQAGTVSGISGHDAIKFIQADLDRLGKDLPMDYRIDIGGSVERSKVATKLLLEPVPVMLIVIATLLIFQLKSTPRMLLTSMTAPMGIIGVVAALFLTGIPLGFMTEIALLALFGIIIRNSVILIDQIQRQIDKGETKWNAIVNAAVFRFRPIMLTASAMFLGMVPLMFDKFWQSTAVTIASGLFGATILTLLVLPVMYAAFFRVGKEERV